MRQSKTIEICVYEDSVMKKIFTVSRVVAIVISEAFENEPVVLDADNFIIPDSVGTRGMLSLQP